MKKTAWLEGADLLSAVWVALVEYGERTGCRMLLVNAEAADAADINRMTEGATL
jgi:hypothetical protein